MEEQHEQDWELLYDQLDDWRKERESLCRHMYGYGDHEVTSAEFHAARKVAAYEAECGR